MYDPGATPDSANLPGITAVTQVSALNYAAPWYGADGTSTPVEVCETKIVLPVAAGDEVDAASRRYTG
ncbi:MAG: hypothetical protein ACM3ML_31200 [Micromonosporaceae bacterium]